MLFHGWISIQFGDLFLLKKTVISNDKADINGICVLFFHLKKTLFRKRFQFNDVQHRLQR